MIPHNPRRLGDSCRHPITLETPFLQAALSGYSDLPMRRLARMYGAHYTLNEVMLDRLVLQPGKKQREILSVAPDDHPVGGQLMGSDPNDFAPAAAKMSDAGYDVIDVNFGCPVKKVLGRCRGGFLLSQPKTAIEILRRVYDAVGDVRPVTVKMRRGMDDSHESERNFFEILDGAFTIGLSAVTVHGRTVHQRYVGPSLWGFLTAVKQHVGDRIIFGSGDLFSATACINMLNETGVDGVSIARGCIGNPWIFEECHELARDGELPPPPSIARQSLAIQRHLHECERVHGPHRAGAVMKKFGVKYSEHHPCSREVRDAFLSASNSDQVRSVLEVWYSPSADYGPVIRREGHGNLVAAGASLEE